ncbi:hypothetical protein C7M84_001771 [Penaeus vannamei]|uniref:PDZ domain-containing protein n=1 Tax=Penaeus vannamei TaxID=6689 RepID=A0A3R7N7S4_PENVA|nr:hypothetical protein C7M84_001771 [Penaeus vannamei]
MPDSAGVSGPCHHAPEEAFRGAECGRPLGQESWADERGDGPAGARLVHATTQVHTTQVHTTHVHGEHRQFVTVVAVDKGTEEAAAAPHADDLTTCHASWGATPPAAPQPAPRGFVTVVAVGSNSDAASLRLHQSDDGAVNANLSVRLAPPDAAHADYVNQEVIERELDGRDRHARAPTAEGGALSMVPDQVVVYRLPGERLGLGLKFDGGMGARECVRRLFIQSVAPDSPAARAAVPWGELQPGDQILNIEGNPVSSMTRVQCVSFLKDAAMKITIGVSSEEVPGAAPEGGAPVPPPPSGFQDLEGGRLAVKHLRMVSEGAEDPEDKEQALQGWRDIILSQRRCPGDLEELLEDLEFSIPGSWNTRRLKEAQDGDLPPRPPSTWTSWREDAAGPCESESDETNSSVSTVIDRLSLSSSTTVSRNSSFNTPADVSRFDLARALSPFEQLEKELETEARPEPQQPVAPTTAPRDETVSAPPIDRSTKPASSAPEAQSGSEAKEKAATPPQKSKLRPSIKAFSFSLKGPPPPPPRSVESGSPAASSSPVVAAGSSPEAAAKEPLSEEEDSDDELDSDSDGSDNYIDLVAEAASQGADDEPDAPFSISCDKRETIKRASAADAQPNISPEYLLILDSPAGDDVLDEFPDSVKGSAEGAAEGGAPPLCEARNEACGAPEQDYIELISVSPQGQGASAGDLGGSEALRVRGPPPTAVTSEGASDVAGDYLKEVRGFGISGQTRARESVEGEQEEVASDSKISLTQRESVDAAESGKVRTQPEASKSQEKCVFAQSASTNSEEKVERLNSEMSAEVSDASLAQGSEVPSAQEAVEGEAAVREAGGTKEGADKTEAEESERGEGSLGGAEVDDALPSDLHDSFGTETVYEFEDDDGYSYVTDNGSEFSGGSSEGFLTCSSPKVSAELPSSDGLPSEPSEEDDLGLYEDLYTDCYAVEDALEAARAATPGLGRSLVPESRMLPSVPEEESGEQDSRPRTRRPLRRQLLLVMRALRQDQPGDQLR